MSGDKTTTQGSQQYTASPEERKLQQTQLSQMQAVAPEQTQVQKSGLNLSNLLLTGQQLPGYLQGLPQGIDQGTVDYLTEESLRHIYPMFQQNGVLDSGSAAQIASKTAADVGVQAKQFNIQNLQQLLNLAFSGQSQVQQPINQNTGILAGLVQGTGNRSSSGSTIGMNPFLKTFQTSLGQGLGNTVNSGFSAALGSFK